MGCGASTESASVPRTSHVNLASTSSGDLIDTLRIHLTDTIGIPASDSCVADYVARLHNGGYSTPELFAKVTPEILASKYNFKDAHVGLVREYRANEALRRAEVVQPPQKPVLAPLPSPAGRLPPVGQSTVQIKSPKATMGCSASSNANVNAPVKDTASDSGTSLTPTDWLERLDLPPDAHTVVLEWAVSLGVSKMGDLKLMKDLLLAQSASSLAPIPLMKLEQALSELATEIHAANGSWPAWAPGGTVNLAVAPSASPSAPTTKPVESAEETLVPPKTTRDESAQSLVPPADDEELRQLLRDVGLSEESAATVARGLQVSGSALSELQARYDNAPEAILAELLASAEARLVQMVCEGIAAKLLRTRLRLPPTFADIVGEAVTMDTALVLQCLRDPALLPQAVIDWSQSDECDAALARTSSALRELLTDQVTSSVRAGTAREVALKSVSALDITRRHITMIVEGRLDDLLSELLTNCGTAALDVIAPELQKKMESAVDTMARAENLASSVPDGIADDLAQMLFEFTEAVPGGKAVSVLLKQFYRAAKGAKYCKEQCDIFAKQLQQVIRVLTKAKKIQLSDSSILEEIEAVVQEALEFVQTLQDRGFIRRIISSKSDDTKLERLSKWLHESVQQLTTELTVEMALTPPSPAEFQRDVDANEQLRNRVEAMGGLDQLDPSDRAMMQELTQDLPFDQQILCEELTFHLEELKQKSDEILKVVSEGPWDIIPNLDVRCFWFKRVKQSKEDAHLVVGLLDDFLQNPPAPAAPELGPLQIPIAEEEQKRLAEALDGNKDGHISVLEAKAAFPAEPLGRILTRLLGSGQKTENKKGNDLINLPPRNRHFTGRSEELRDLLSPTDTSPLCIHAEAGTGKTSLLVEAAWQARDQWSGHVAMADVAGLLSVAELSRTIAVAMGGRGEEEDELKQLLSAGDASPWLLLVDNMMKQSDIAQVVKLVQNTSPLSRVIMASGGPLQIQDVTDTPLGALSMDHSAQLLRKLTPGVDEQFRTRLESALQTSLSALEIVMLAPAVMDATTQQQQDDLCAKMSSENSDEAVSSNDSSDALISLSAAFPDGATFDAEAAGAVANDAKLSKAEAVSSGEDLVRSLKRSRQLETPADGRYRIFSRVASHFRQVATDGEASEAVQRHARHFLVRLGRISRLFDSSEQLVALRMFDEDRLNFDAALQMDPIPDSLLDCHTDLRVKTVLRSRWGLRPMVAYFGRVETALKQRGGCEDSTEMANALHNMAMVRDDLGEHQEALQLYDRALKIMEATYGPQHSSVAATLNNMASVRKALGEHQEALQLYDRAVRKSTRL
eukprot:COSAG02_NODE_1606_length_11716_cov_7.032022_5_plen_1312_part_01